MSMVSKTNIAAKEAKVNIIKERLAECEMIFSVPLAGLSVAEVRDLKSKLPPTTTAGTVKNTLMRRAIAESKWETAGEFTKQSSIWVFVKDDIKGSVKAYSTFAKDLKREDINGGVLEGVAYDAEGIGAISELPSRKELIAKIASAIKMVPTKLGRSVNAVPTKVARAIKLAVADESEGDAPAAE